MSLKYLVLDSEKKLDTTSIKNIILDFAPESIVYTASSLDEARRVLSVLFIDVLFVNVLRSEMTEESILAAFSNRTFEIVFIDVYNPQAIKPVKDDTVHHLYKPIKKTEIKAMLQRLNDHVNARIKNRAQHMETGNEYILSKKLSVSHREGIYFLPLKNIVYFEADNTLLYYNARR
jgi:DNA-binding LytR/AlgR family response regulator